MYLDFSRAVNEQGKEKIAEKYGNLFRFCLGEKLLAPGTKIESVQVVFSGILQVTRQVQDGRVLNVRRLGPGDSFGEISLLTGMHADVSF